MFRAGKAAYLSEIFFFWGFWGEWNFFYWYVVPDGTKRKGAAFFLPICCPWRDRNKNCAVVVGVVPFRQECDLRQMVAIGYAQLRVYGLPVCDWCIFATGRGIGYAERCFLTECKTAIGMPFLSNSIKNPIIFLSGTKVTFFPYKFLISKPLHKKYKTLFTVLTFLTKTQKK